MTIHLLAFLIGLFIVPLLLLMFGHRLRRRSARARAAFWGAIIGHGLASTIALGFGLTPAVEWTSDDTMRGLAGYWSLLALPVLGGLAGWLLARGR